MKTITTVKDIANLAHVSCTTVRRLVDAGHVEANRNYCNWRIFEDPEQVAAKIRSLVYGMDKRGFQKEENS
tara:strand:+ start:3158 stop:3370 length:213 start_codon:yes stop_codon:yes gene_type:complete